MTQLLSAFSHEDIQQAADAILAGQLVVYPTDTVYGLGCAVDNPTAIEAIYVLKGRDRAKSLPVLLGDLSNLDQVVAHIPAAAQILIEKFWPGPLTIVVPKAPHLPANLSSNDGIAVRVPNSVAGRAFIRAAGGAVATTSTNPSGQPSAQTAAMAQAYFDGRVAAILDAGPSPEAVASTIIDCRSDKLLLLREGPIGRDALAPFLS